MREPMSKQSSVSGACFLSAQPGSAPICDKDCFSPGVATELEEPFSFLVTETDNSFP